MSAFFACDTVEHPEHVQVVLEGELDVATAPSVVDAVQAAIAAGHRKLVLDLLALKFVDSMGLRALVLARRAVETVGGELVFTRSTAQVERILAVTRFDSIFRFTHRMD